MVSGITTTLLLLGFLALIAWCWRGDRKSGFDAAARMPLESEEDGR